MQDAAREGHGQQFQNPNIAPPIEAIQPPPILEGQGYPKPNFAPPTEASPPPPTPESQLNPNMQPRRIDTNFPPELSKPLTAEAPPPLTAESVPQQAPAQQQDTKSGIVQARDQQEFTTQTLEAPTPPLSPSQPETTVQPTSESVANPYEAISGEPQQATISEPSSTQELKDLEKFTNIDAGLSRNDGTPLNPVSEQPSETTPSEQPGTPENPSYEAIFENWKDLKSTEFTIAFNSFMQTLRNSGSLDSATEEGLVRHFTAILSEKTGLNPESKPN